MADNKTRPTEVKVDDFLQTVSDKRRYEASQLIELMRKVSGEEPVMWGPSIIGFGMRRYKTGTGREGDIGILGFSPRKAALTIYFYEGFDRYGEELARLGKHKISQSCLYVNKLEDIGLQVLEAMLRKSYKVATEEEDKPDNVESYIASIPPVARPQFDKLRKIVRSQVPDAYEVLSYGIIGYKPDINKRAAVFISGWKDHVAIYPIPKDEAIREKLEPYVHGKGTLWFGLEAPLPEELIREVVNKLL